MDGSYCPPGKPGGKKKSVASGDRYMQQHAQAQALARRSKRHKMPTTMMQGSE